MAAGIARQVRTGPRAIDPAGQGLWHGEGDRRSPAGRRREPRRLTAQGLERKQQLLDRAAELFAERGYAETRVHRHRPRTPAWPRASSTGTSRTRKPCSRSWPSSIRLGAPPGAGRRAGPGGRAAARDLRQGTEASVHFMAEHAHFFALLEVENGRKLHRRAAPGHRACTSATPSRLVQAGQADGTIRDEDPVLLALGVVGSVGLLLPLPPHRPQLDLPLDELAAFVGRYVVQAARGRRGASPALRVLRRRYGLRLAACDRDTVRPTDRPGGARRGRTSSCPMSGWTRPRRSARSTRARPTRRRRTRCG